MNPRRYRIVSDRSTSDGPILYWMHRNMRARDNWALIHARTQALLLNRPVHVVFCLANEFLDAASGAYAVMLQGLRETAGYLETQNIPFIALTGNPPLEVSTYAKNINAGLVVTDFDPLRVKRHWLNLLIQACTAPIHEVDARNIVPCWIASDKREFMAKTIRPKIHRQLQEFLDPFPELSPHPHPLPDWHTSVNWDHFGISHVSASKSAPVPWLTPGENGGLAALQHFLTTRLSRYGQRNDPNQPVCSDLSVHLHFGMLSSQRIVLEIMRRGLKGDHVDSFIEELVVRRELADNFCLYTPEYDSVTGFPAWAQSTLHDHRHDPRPAIYSLQEFEATQTHDPLWNAAQNQMRITGKMHGYLRMYWAKKILEWSPDAASAMRTAIYLNDHYSLDGRDTNGYTGIAWSIGGVHDRGWTERPIFGKIRYMNYQGARRKFDVDAYIRTWHAQPQHH